MAKLENLYTNVLHMSDEDMRDFFESYFIRRAEDIAKSKLIAVKSKASTRGTSGETLTKKVKKLSVTPDQLELLKKLGLCK